MKKVYFVALAVFLVARLRAESDMSINSASVGPNLLFFLRSAKNWNPTNQFNADETIYWYVGARGTNNVFFRTFPANQMFDFRMVDASGNELKKTKTGLESSIPVDLPSSKRDVMALRGHITGGAYALFRAENMFHFPSNGIYELKIRLRLWTEITNSTPDIEPIAHFMKTAQTNIHFGIVTSAPVRVKIIKD